LEDQDFQYPYHIYIYIYKAGITGALGFEY
jgi:hypothetical protein